MEQDKAVALAEKHDGYWMYRKTNDTRFVEFTEGCFYSMLADHEQQVIQRLVDESGVMPEVWHDVDNGGAFCWAKDLRKAIAGLQAKNELLAKRAADNFADAVESFAKLEQSEERVREFEGILVRAHKFFCQPAGMSVEDVRNHKVFKEKMQQVEDEAEALKRDIDAAIKKEGGVC